MNDVYLGLGSNLGDRVDFLDKATEELSKLPKTELIKSSSYLETYPISNIEQGLFLNAACHIKTDLTPRELLEKIKNIEKNLGRKQTERWGERVIDIDILLYDGELVEEDDLEIPHPLMHDRYFVLKPLLEIAPEVVHPILNETIQELYEKAKIDEEHPEHQLHHRN